MLLAQQSRWGGQIAGIIAVVALIFWFVQMRKAPSSLLQWRDCEHAYAAARTAADTMTVDQRQPILGTPQRDTVTCGSLRGRR